MWEACNRYGMLVFFLRIRGTPGSKKSRSSAASDGYKGQPGKADFLLF